MHDFIGLPPPLAEKKLYSVFCILYHNMRGAGGSFFLKKVKLLGGVSSFETC